MNNGQFVNILWQPIHCLVWFGSKALMQSGLLGWFCGEKQETNIDCSFSVVLVTHCTLGEKFNSRGAYNDCCQHLVSWYIKIPCQKHHISSMIHLKEVSLNPSIFTQSASHDWTRLKPNYSACYIIILCSGEVHVKCLVGHELISEQSSLTVIPLQALAHSSGYDSTDEEDTGPLEPQTRSGLRAARSEEFLDRRSPERRPGPSHRSVEDIYWD